MQITTDQWEENNIRKHLLGSKVTNRHAEQYRMENNCRFDRYVREESLNDFLLILGHLYYFKISHKPLPDKGEYKTKP